MPRLSSRSPRNNPARKGRWAARPDYAGPFSRFAIGPVHTRLDSVVWVVCDAEARDEYDLPAIYIFLTENEARAFLARLVEKAEAEASAFEN